MLGFYGGDDARVTSTVAPAEAEMKKLGKTYEPHVFEGAGHGFLRAQEDRERREPQGHAEGLAADGGVSEGAPEVEELCWMGGS